MWSERFKNVVRASIPRSVRNSLRSPSKSAVWLWDSARFSLGRTKTLDLSLSISIVCHPHAYRVFYAAQVADAEQAAEFRNFISHCSSSMFLFDIGAHFGVFSLTAAHFGGKAIAVDPSPTAIRMMAIQAALNRCSDRIQIIEAAVSDAEGGMDMLSSGVFGAGYFKVARGRSKRELTRTRSITIDQIASQFGAPTHIKIDVEGHEGAVLRGARNTLRRFSPLIFLELHNEMIRCEGGDPHSTLDELKQLGYDTFVPTSGIFDSNKILEKPIARIVARRTGR